MENDISCLVVDDHPAIRFALKRILESNGVRVIAESDNGIDALKAVEEFTPDVIVLDIDIPMLDGFEVIKRLRRSYPDIKILVITASSSDSFSVRCFYAGANGFLRKTDSIDLLPNVIKQIQSGYDFFSHSVHEIARKMSTESTDNNNSSVFTTLSNRELSVLKGLVSGKTNMQIATELMLSNKTISTYKARIIEKTGMHNLQDIIETYKKDGA
ncbi:DNA-binding response regulator [Aeromonas sp. CA23]|uniref:response regulator transcription factor n=1 Tax=Aeromonas sp. CA23 TaxID=2033032 RepID=UPI000BFBA900|nr:response regulator transcription factor [Aeromonas sp. CA23]ATM01005.1 DNA-binding response regulator [Aeromonas sp. CA23]